MSRSRQIVLVKLLDTGDGESPSVLNSVPLGTMGEVIEEVSHHNISTDGSPDSMGVLYGPGLLMQLPMLGPDDPVSQVMVSIEEETAWPVLQRMCKRLSWKMMDPNTGRMFG